MNDHAQFQDKLFAYLDFEIDDAERTEIEQHIERCAECAEELEITRRANDLFKTVEPQPLPDGFMTRFQAKLAESGSAPTVVPAAPSLSVVPPAPLPVSDLPKTTVQMPAPPAVRKRFSFGRAAGLLAAVLAAVLGLTILLKPNADDPALAPAAIACSEGDIELQRGSSATLVTQAMALHPGDALVTSSNGRAVVTLGNAGSVRLAPGSRMRVVALDTSGSSGRLDAKLELEEGSIWVEEAGGVHCALQAGSTLVVPMGTAYEASLRDGLALVNVWEGRVQLSGLADLKPALLEAGQRAEIAKGLVKLELINAKTALANTFTEWNLRLQRPAHPKAGPLLQPTLVQSITPPTWVANPPPAPSPQGKAGSAPVSAQPVPAPVAATPRRESAESHTTAAAPPAGGEPQSTRTAPPVASAQPASPRTAGGSGSHDSGSYPTAPVRVAPTGPRVVYATPPARTGTSVATPSWGGAQAHPAGQPSTTAPPQGVQRHAGAYQPPAQGTPQSGRVSPPGQAAQRPSGDAHPGQAASRREGWHRTQGTPPAGASWRPRNNHSTDSSPGTAQGSWRPGNNRSTDSSPGTAQGSPHPRWTPQNHGANRPQWTHDANPSTENGQQPRWNHSPGQRWTPQGQSNQTPGQRWTPQESNQAPGQRWTPQGTPGHTWTPGAQTPGQRWTPQQWNPSSGQGNPSGSGTSHPGGRVPRRGAGNN